MCVCALMSIAEWEVHAYRIQLRRRRQGDNYELLCRLWSPLAGAEEGGAVDRCRPWTQKELKESMLENVLFYRIPMIFLSFSV